MGETRHTRALVIGGGIMGTSVAYHLALEGWSDVILCEKAELTSGATWHAAGLCSHTVASLSIGWIANYSINLYQRLEAQTGQSVSWHGTGGIRLAYNDLEHDWNRHTLGLGRCLGLPMEFISLEEVARLNPLFDPGGAVAALRTYADGHVDPAGACHALARGARALGATIRRRCRVRSLHQRASGEWEADTEHGPIVAEHVVNAAGYYGRQVGQWMGAQVPLAPVLHTYLVTEPVEALDALDHEIPIMRDDTYRGYIRQEQRALLIGIYESRGAKAVWTDGPPWDSEHELFEPDYDVIAPWLEGAFRRTPVAERLGIRRVVRGAITHTPDGSALLGPVPGVHNAWLATGSMVGIGWGGGMGRLLAQWMVHGDTEVSVRAFDPRRFGPHVDDRFIVAKSVEDYEVRHDTPVPGMQRPALRPLRASPIHSRTEAHGAVFGEVHGFERPRWFRRGAGPGFDPDAVPGSMLQGDDANGWRRQPWFEAVGEECRAVRERVGVLDLTAFTKLEVSGAHAGDALERMVANRLPRADGGIVLAHALTDAGTIESEFTITRLGSRRFYLCSGAASERRDLDCVRRAAGDGEVEIVNRSSTWGCLLVTGPRAVDVLGAGSDVDLSQRAFPWLTGRDMRLFDIECRVLRVSYTGECGFEIHVAAGSMLALYDALWRAGESAGIVDFGSHALNSLRLEKGYRGGTELTSEVTLPEADLMRFASLDRTQFRGRDATLARLEAGPRYRLVQLAIAAADAARAGADCGGTEPVLAGESTVGSTTSGGFGYTTGKSYAFAYVDPDHAAPGTELAVLVLGRRCPATVLDGPDYDPASTRLRA